MDDEAELKITLPTNLGVSVVPGAAQAFVAKKVAVIKNAPYLWSDGVLRPHPNYNGRFQYLL